MTVAYASLLEALFKSPYGSPFGLGLILISFLFLGLAVLLFVFQSKLVYLPQMPPGSRDEVWTPSRFGYGPAKQEKYQDGDEAKWEEVEILTVDRQRLQAFWIDAPSKWKRESNSEGVRERIIHGDNQEEEKTTPFTIIYFQANAGNIGHRIPIAKKLQETIDCNVLLVSYRGFGKSSGSPSERGIKLDSQAALDYVWNQKLLSDGERNKIVLYGQSIGGAVAIHLTAANPNRIRFLIVENTFTSIPKLIPRVAPILAPFAFLCTQKWTSHLQIPKISARILFLAGKIDELIPPDHMIELHRLAVRSGSRMFVNFDKGTHNDTCIQDGYFEAIQDFLTRAPKTPRVTVEEVTDDEANPKIKNISSNSKSTTTNASTNNCKFKPSKFTRNSKKNK